MKKIRILFFMLALVLIFVGASGVTKASAEEGVKLTIVTEGEVTGATAVYTPEGGQEQEWTEESLIPVGAQVVITYTLRENKNYIEEFASEGDGVNGIHDPVIDLEYKTVSFSVRGTGNVIIKITAEEKPEQNARYLVTWNLTLPEGCESVRLLDEYDKVIARGTSIAAGTGIFAECVPATGYKLTVGLDDKDTKIDWSGGNKYGFIMPAKDVKLVITAEKVDDKNDEQEEEPSGGEGITVKTMDYDAERINITSGKQVFFQIVKSTNDLGKIKATNWIKAAKNAETGEYAIDFSPTSNTKDIVYALTVDATVDGSKQEQIETVTVNAAIKSAKITLNYKAEELGNDKLYEIIGEMKVKGIDAGYDKEWKLGETGAENLKDIYILNWKRGANDAWKDGLEFDQMNWDMVKASNSTLYINISGAKGTNDSQIMEFRPSKETKVKVPKAAKAPSVKVDYVKGTLALKNGMQVKVNNSAAWMDVVAYDKNITPTVEENVIFALAADKETTKTKISSVTISDFIAAVKDAKLLNKQVTDGEEITIEVRTAATTKKFPSNSGFMKIVLPEKQPEVMGFVDVERQKEDEKEELEAFFEIDFSKLMNKPAADKYEEYEYVFVGNKAEGVNLAKQKWTKIPATGKVNLTKYIGKECSWYKSGADEASKFKYDEMDAVLIRKAAVKASGDEPGKFASNYSTVDVLISDAVSVLFVGEEEGQHEFEIKYDSPSAITNCWLAEDKDVQIVKAKAGTKVMIVSYCTEPKIEVDTVSITYGIIGPEKAQVIPYVSGMYSFVMPEADVAIKVTVKQRQTTGQ